MTRQELQVIVDDLLQKSTALSQKANELQSFMTDIKNTIADSNPFAETINIDQLVAIQTPIYLQLLTAIETAADVIGTDSLH